MPVFCVVYTKIPTNFNDSAHALVDSPTPEDAYKLVEQRLGNDRVRNYVINKPYEYKPEPTEGKILDLDHRG